MAVTYPHGQFLPLGPQTEERMAAHDVICLHTMAGFSLEQCDAEFRTNGYQGKESHFGVGHDGVVFQWQDLDHRADANLDGNDRVISIETADKGPGFGPWTEATDVPAWTDAQVESIAQLVAWLCDRYSIPCAQIPNTRPEHRGIGYHRQGIKSVLADGLVAGGVRWSAGPKECPGDRRIRQIATVIEKARNQLGGVPTSVHQEATTMRFVNLTNDDGSTPTRSAILTVDAVGQSIVMPPGSRAWVQWSAFFPGAGEQSVARLDWLVVTFGGRTQPFDPRDLRHRDSNAVELGPGATGVEVRVSGIPQGGVVGFHIDGINHA